MGVATRSATSTLTTSRWSVSRLRRQFLPAFILTFLTLVVLSAFLSPLVRSLTVSFKSPDQLSRVDSPIWPADPQSFTYQGKSYEVYVVPVDGGTKDLALVK